MSKSLEDIGATSGKEYVAKAPSGLPGFLAADIAGITLTEQEQKDQKFLFTRRGSLSKGSATVGKFNTFREDDPGKEREYRTSLPKIRLGLACCVAKGSGLPKNAIVMPALDSRILATNEGKKALFEMFNIKRRGRLGDMKAFLESKEGKECVVEDVSRVVKKDDGSRSVWSDLSAESRNSHFLEEFLKKAEANSANGGADTALEPVILPIVENGAVVAVILQKNDKIVFLKSKEARSKLVDDLALDLLEHKNAVFSECYSRDEEVTFDCNELDLHEVDVGSCRSGQLKLVQCAAEVLKNDECFAGQDHAKESKKVNDICDDVGLDKNKEHRVKLKEFLTESKITTVSRTGDWDKKFRDKLKKTEFEELSDARKKAFFGETKAIAKEAVNSPIELIKDIWNTLLDRPANLLGKDRFLWAAAIGICVIFPPFAALVGIYAAYRITERISDKVHAASKAHKKKHKEGQESKIKALQDTFQSESKELKAAMGTDPGSYNPSLKQRAAKAVRAAGEKVKNAAKEVTGRGPSKSFLSPSNIKPPATPTAKKAGPARSA